MADYAKDVLVETDWVAEHLDDDSDPDRRGRREPRSLRRGPHPRRDRLRLEARPPGPGQARLPRAGGLRQLMGSRGISNDHTVVLYGDRNNWFAAYTYWYFLYYGHDKVKLVNGPREKWIAEGRETTHRGPVATRRRPSTRAAGDESIRAYRDEVLRRSAASSEPGRRAQPAGVLGRADRDGRLRAGGRAARAATSRAPPRSLGAGGQRGRHLQVGATSCASSTASKGVISRRRRR